MADGPDQKTDLGQMTKWRQIFDPPGWLNEGRVELERGQSLISGGAVEYLGDNRWRISFPPSSAGGGGGGGGVYALPAGLMMGWPGLVEDEATDLPSGWMICDGRELAQEDYADLYRAIGDIYTAIPNAATFNIPDYRGRTLIGARPLNADQNGRVPLPADDPPYETPIRNEGRLNAAGVDIDDILVSTHGSLQLGFNVENFTDDSSDARPIPPNAATTWVIKATSTFPESDESGLVFTTKVAYNPESETDLAFDEGELTLTVGASPWEIEQDNSDAFQQINIPTINNAATPAVGPNIALLPWQPSVATPRLAHSYVHTAFHGKGGKFYTMFELRSPSGVVSYNGKSSGTSHYATLGVAEGVTGDTSHGAVLVPAGYQWRLHIKYIETGGKNINRSGYVLLQAPPKLSLKLRDELVPDEEEDED